MSVISLVLPNYDCLDNQLIVTRFESSEGLLIDLYNSTPLNSCLFPNALSNSFPFLKEACLKLASEIGFSGSKIKLRHAALENIISNLIYANQIGKVLHYSRNDHYYTAFPFYHLPHFTRTFVLSIIDALNKRGYVEQVPGFYNRKTNDRKTSRVWATRKLINFLMNENFDLYGQDKQLKLIESGKQYVRF